MQPLLILGTRSFAAQLAALVSEFPGFEAAGFVENLEQEKCGQPLDGLPVYWVEELAQFAATHLALCGLGTTRRSRFIEQVARLGIRFATLIHPSALIAPRVTIGEGSIVSPGVIIAPYTRIDKHVLINRGALIGHHTEIGDYATLSSGVNVAGNCRIGAASYLGMGALILDGKTIGEHTIVGAGAVVTKDVPDHVEVLGIPARVVKEGIEGK